MSMRFLADENIERSLVRALRKAGHDVRDIKEGKLCGISDEQVLKMASDEDRIILTHDKDFLNLSRRPVGKHPGIILLRVLDSDADMQTRRVESVVRSVQKPDNTLWIISETYIEIIRG